MKKFKLLVSLTLVLTLIISVIVVAPINAGAAQTFTQIFNVNSDEAFASAIAQINSSAAGDYAIYLGADISHQGGYSVKNNLTIFGEGHSINLNNLNQCFVISNGATLNLGADDYNKTLTISGDGTMDSDSDNDNPGLLYVWGETAVCNMYSGVTLQNHKGNNFLGGGVTVQSGTFNMNGGKIDNCGIDGGSLCYGGGVAVYGQGRFIFNDGVISNCYAYSNAIKTDNTDDRALSNFGGGIFVTGASTFIMNGGTVTKNKSTLRGGGIAVVTSNSEKSAHSNQFGYIDSKVRINGGTITENESAIGGGVCVTGNEFAYSSEISFNAKVEGFTEEVINNNNSANTKRSKLSVGANSLTFTGDDVATGFNTYGGTVENNTATFGGGGMYIFSSRPNVSINNTSINSNIAKGENTDVTILNSNGKVKGKGGGVYVGGYYVNTYINNSTINSNTSALNGGGIAVHSDNGVHLQNTDINNNISGDRGAGVYYHTDANKNKVYISGANTIQNNKFNDKLNNVNVVSTTKPLYVEGSLEGSKIGLSDPRLWDDNLTDAQAPDDGSAELLTNGYKANNPDVHPSKYFTSDHDTWIVDYGEKKTEQGAEIGRTYTYSAKKYNTISRTKGSKSAKGTLIDVKAKTFSSGKADTRQKMYDEITARYKEEYVETSTDNYYDPISGSNIQVLLYAQNMVHIYVDGLYIIAGLSYQQYVEDGHLALVFVNGNLDEAEYSSEYTEETVVLDEPIDETVATNYTFNDIGHIISKTEILKNTEIVDIQYDTITTDYTNEVRLVRRNTPIKFHDNKDKVGKGEDKLFRVYNGDASEAEDTTEYTFKNGGVEEFYNIPKFAEDDYVFAGWYTVADNDDNSESKAFEFNTAVPSDVEDVYAHWIPVGEVSKDANDDKELPSGMTKYKGFEMFGVQIRPEVNYDSNYGEFKPGGLRFIASISEELLENIKDVHEDNKIEYGFVTAAEKTVNTVVDGFSIDKNTYKLQYNGENVNGVDTTQKSANANNFRYITNVDCTSKVGGYGTKVKEDHRNFNDYRLVTYVVTYNDDESGANKAKNVAARAYLRYTDANGLLRTFYNDYNGTNFYGGCSTSYNAVKDMATNTKTVK